MTVPEQAVEAAAFKPLSETPCSLDAAQNFAQSRAVMVIVPEELHPDTKHLVQCFAEELARKLRSAEQKYGYSDGWLTQDWRDECLAHMHDHIAKGDPRDVAVYAAFMWARGWPTAAPPLVGVQQTAPKVWFSPAECYTDCNDPMCPYVHQGGWQCEGVEGLFATEEEARAALPAQSGSGVREDVARATAFLAKVREVLRTRFPRCRDCADDGPVCPNSGLPCDLAKEFDAVLLALPQHAGQAQEGWTTGVPGHRLIDLVEGRLTLLMNADLPETDHPLATQYILDRVREAIAALSPAPASPQPREGAREMLCEFIARQRAKLEIVAASASWRNGYIDALESVERVVLELLPAPPVVAEKREKA